MIEIFFSLKGLLKSTKPIGEKDSNTKIMARINNSRKALFQTPNSTTGFSANEEHSVSTLTNSALLLSKLDIAEKALANVHAESEFSLSAREAHKERLMRLKQLIGEIDEDNWKFDNVCKLIGT